MIFYRTYPLEYSTPFATPNTLYVTSTLSGALFWGNLIAVSAWEKGSDERGEDSYDGIHDADLLFVITEVDIPPETPAWYAHSTWADETPLKSPIPIGQIKQMPLGKMSQIWINNPPQYPTKKLGIANKEKIVFDSGADLQKNIKVYVDIFRDFYLTVNRIVQNDMHSYVSDRMSVIEKANVDGLVDFVTTLEKVSSFQSLFSEFLETDNNRFPNMQLIQLLPDFHSYTVNTIVLAIERWIKSNGNFVNSLSDSVIWRSSLTDDEFVNNAKQKMRVFSRGIHTISVDAMNILELLKEVVKLGYDEYRLLIKQVA